MIYKLYSFNVNGIRAIGKKGFWEWLDQEKPDILAIQEIKADNEIMLDLKSGHPNLRLNLLVKDIFDLNTNSISSYQPNTPPSNSLGYDFNTSGDTSTNYNMFWHACTMKKGYSGTAIFFKADILKDVEIFTGIGNPKFDVEGRLTGLKTKDFTLVNCYYPQGGREGRVAYKIDFYQELYHFVQALLSKGQKVVLTGDFNTTLTDIDLARPRENRKTTGCLPEERLAMRWLLDPKHFDETQLQVTNPDFAYLNNLNRSSLNFVDSFRHFYPVLKDKYTYWDQITRARERNVGWRIDYFNLSPELLPNLKSADICDQVFGSDHCPVMIELEF